jgi:hypothetical protein
MYTLFNDILHAAHACGKSLPDDGYDSQPKHVGVYSTAQWLVIIVKNLYPIQLLGICTILSIGNILYVSTVLYKYI